MSRREQTERLMLQALEAVIRENGMAGVGVNAIAKRAGVSKELIYRYFDGLPGLLMAWMSEQDYWTGHADLLAVGESSARPPAELILAMLRAQIDALAGNESLREIRRWELVERNEVTACLAERRERSARAFIDRVDGLTDAADVPAQVSIMLAGVLYLMLRSKTESHFLGVPLRSAQGWERLYAALENMVQGLPEPLKSQPLSALEAARPTSKKGRDAGHTEGEVP
ncbi:TetR/AcrR family transcriptional regulator [Bordetella genomosp. 12]|uniref:TetR family transcriptional regulator n=1 Tax=Bordetella genomosp. 12 TaxID=463035 RepID=A0A261VB69_9BORD|nr:TetR/AcrR family transcriptional regulator [Bordetella genomosp. 12]OZI70822.1 TetR family transcriptional regulator [Bordetella genomosp. 12]